MARVSERTAILFAGLPFIAALASMLFAAQRPVAGPQPRLVMAHHMTQMSPGAAVLPRDAAIARWRGPGQVLGELRAAEQRFAGDPVGAARNDVLLASAAGLDGFAVLLGPGTMRHQFASAVDAIFTAAEETPSFRLAPDLWLNDATDTAALDALSVDLGTLARTHDRAWRRVNGRRLVSIMLAPTAANNGATPAALDRLFAGVGGRKAVYLVLYDPARLAAKNPLVLGAADAVTRWPTEPFRQTLDEDAKARTAAALFGKPVIAATIPSFMQSRPNPGIVPNVREKLGPSAFLAQWRAAIRRREAGMYVATWNDRTEDSGLAPEVGHGEAFLLLNRYLADSYRGGAPAAVGEERVMLFHHPQLVGDAAARAGASFRWMQSPPATDYLMAVAMLARPADISLVAGDRVLARCRMSAGLSALLAYVPASAPPEAYPTDADGITAQPIGALALGPPSLVVSRADATWRFASSRPIVPRGPVLDLTTHADVFPLAPAGARSVPGAGGTPGPSCRPILP